MNSEFKVGVITSTHGVHGEVKVFPTTDDAKRFKKLKDVVMDFKGERIPLKIESVKFFKQFVILKFDKYNSLNDVEFLRNAELYVSRENAVKLGMDEYYVADLIGINCISDDGSYEGTLTDVLSTGANDVYEISLKEGKTILLPAIKECIKEVDVENNKMIFHIMEGLLD